MKRLSATIITLNEEDKIRPCLESLREIADEIVVVDSLSTDSTKAICEEFGVRFVEQKWLGYSEQKNLANEIAAYDWILSIDADEVISEELKKSILKIKENDIVVDSISKNTLGTVLAVDYNNYYTELTYDEITGQGKMVEYTDRYNVTVTIVAQGVYTKGEGYTVNSRRVAVGEKMSLRFPDYVGEGYCISFSGK